MNTDTAPPAAASPRWWRARGRDRREKTIVLLVNALGLLLMSLIFSAWGTSPAALVALAAVLCVWALGAMMFVRWQRNRISA
ncbi:hypothetical protein [Candidatus Poriferisodalis sp.]|uniref:hypothetical protein n=1 Tax=Candidatus Poriferisodalis sp. TaxID=3101277 RepID=UPI003B023A8F